MVSAPSFNVDMSLDDIVSNSKKAQRFKSKRGRGRMGGNTTMRTGRGMSHKNYSGRSFGGGVGKRGRRQLPDIWDKGSLLERSNSILSNATKDVVISSNRLLISNLNFGVTDDDIKELFSTCGQLKKAVINYDNTGHSNGTAEVVYFDRTSSQKAYNNFNGVCLDKRPLKIQFLDGPDASKTTVSRLTFPSNAFASRRPLADAAGNGNRRNFNSTRGGNNRGRGGARRGRFSSRGRKGPKSAAALDQEMVDYQNNEVEMK